VDTEVDNLRALVPLLSTGHEEVAQQIACSIGWYHDVRQTFRDGIEELSRFADSLTHPSSSRVALLTTLGWLLLRMERLDEAQELAGSAAALRRECGAPDWDDVGVERIRGEITRRVGDPHGAIEIARETLRRDLSERGRGRMYNLLGTTSATIEDYDTAYEGCRQELEIYQDLGYEGMVAGAHGNLAEVALRKGDMPAAARHQRDCLRLAVEQGSTVMVAFSLIVAARVAAWRDQWATATSLHARAETLLDEIGLVLYDDDKRRSEDFLIDARERLGHEEFGEAHSDGREMPIAEAVKAAEEALGAPS
jgi:tetratricopeptide (TPR) repeat protein